VTTVNNLVYGVGVVRPPPPPPKAVHPLTGKPVPVDFPGAVNPLTRVTVQAEATAAGKSIEELTGEPPSSPAKIAEVTALGGIPETTTTPAPVADGGPTVPAPMTARPWKIEAMFEMSSTAPVFMDEYENSIEGLALTVADRLYWAMDIPLSRFCFWFPDPAATVDPSNVFFCQSKMTEREVGALSARWAGQQNTTYKCTKEKHKMNTSMPMLLQQTATAKKGLSFEVGVYPPGVVAGDTKPGVQVATELVEYASGGGMPERRLLTTGLWTYKAGPGVKYQGLFPATSASLPGTPLAQPRETSLPLGPNPGGHGATPAPTVPVGSVESAALEAKKAKQAAYFANIDVVVHEATKINTEVRNSLQELKDSLARSSAVHSAWMNMKPYKLPADLTGL